MADRRVKKAWISLGETKTTSGLPTRKGWCTFRAAAAVAFASRMTPPPSVTRSAECLPGRSFTDAPSRARSSGRAFGVASAVRNLRGYYRAARPNGTPAAAVTGQEARICANRLSNPVASLYRTARNPVAALFFPHYSSLHRKAERLRRASYGSNRVMDDTLGTLYE